MATRIETASGFSCEIDEEQLQDFEFMEVLREGEKNPLAIVDIFAFLLGRDGLEALKRHLREKNGRASVEDMKTELLDIMGQLRSKKK